MDDKSDRKDAPQKGLTHAVKGGLSRAPASLPKVQVVPRQTNESNGDLAAEHHAGPHSLPQAHVDFAPEKAVIVEVDAADDEPRKRRSIATRIIPREAIVAASKRAEPTRWPYVIGIVVVLAAMGWFVTRGPLEAAHEAKEQNEKHEAMKASSRVLASPVAVTVDIPTPPVHSAANPVGSAAAASVGSPPVQGVSKDLKFLEPKK